MKSLSRLVPAMLLAFIAAGCMHNSPTAKNGVPSGTITHVVVMYLNDRGDLTGRSEVMNAANTLRPIHGIQSIWAGRMITSDRPVVDQSYDVALVATFADQEALQRYLNDPVHLRVKRQVLDRYVRKYVVYDFVSE